MKRAREPGPERGLFDLPLEGSRRAKGPPSGGSSEALPLFPEEDAQIPAPIEETPTDPGRPEEAAPRSGQPASLAARLRGGLFDLAVLAVVLALVLATTAAMGIRPRLAHWPAMLLFLVAFSFLYYVLPLAFWGRTPGMWRSGLVARSRDGRQLSIAQTTLRWLGAASTVALGGLPFLVALSGRSIADRLSGSVTLFK